MPDGIHTVERNALMEILIIDNNPKEIEKLTALLREKEPGSRIMVFIDPMLAVKYGYNNPVDVVYVKNEIQRLSVDDVERLLRYVHPEVRVEILDDIEDEGRIS